MQRIVINGPAHLAGELGIQGSKNTALPVIAACLLTKDECVIKNCPDISDVREMIALVTGAGCESRFENNVLTIKASGLNGMFDYGKCRRFRGSSLLMGAMLGRKNFFVMPYPGGCSIGRRPLNFHFEGFKAMGADIFEENSLIAGWCQKKHGACYEFSYPSVGALENLLLMAVKTPGTSEFRNCSMEPEIVDLCDFLCGMGAVIHGAGTPTIVVKGTAKLHGTEYVIPGDRIVCGTYMAACAICGGNVCFKGIMPKRLPAEIEILRKSGAHIFTDEKNNEIIVMADNRPKAVSHIETGPFPGFPTDMQPQIMALMAYADGMSLIKDNVFDGRYNTAGELAKMGADAEVTDSGVLIKGCEMLYGCRLYAKDLRNGAALVIAALGALGTSFVGGCEHIARGYENIVCDLSRIGADVTWQEEIEEPKQNE